MRGYVIEFNRRTGDRRVTEFATPREAMEYRLQLEAGRLDEDIEIVALISDSLETVQRTHSRYFKGKRARFDTPQVPVVRDDGFVRP